jgi:hypothetical protein
VNIRIQNTSYAPSVLVLVGIPLTRQNRERFGLLNLEIYFNVVFLDLRPLLSRNIVAESTLEDNSKLFEIKTIVELENVLNVYEKEIIVDTVNENHLSTEILQILKKLNRKLIVIQRLALPEPTLSSRILFHARKAIGDLKLGHRSHQISVADSEKHVGTPKTNRNITKVLRDKLSTKLSKAKLKRYKGMIGIVCGNRVKKGYARICEKIHHIPSFDYSNYLSAINNDSCCACNENSYILFMDDYLPSALDWLTLNEESPVTKDSYYESLCIFFEDIERQFGLPIVIAGHPDSKTDRSLTENFKGRRVVWDESEHLCKHAKIVFLHSSGSVSYPILHSKPIYFLTTTELNRSYYSLNIYTMGKLLSRPVINIDLWPQQSHQSLKLNFNRRKYRKYIDNYICKDSAKTVDANLWIIDFLLKESRLLGE